MDFALTTEFLTRWAIAAGLILAAIPLSGWLVKLIKAGALRSAGSAGSGLTRAKFVAEALRVGILVGAVVVALQLAGVNMASIAAVLGAATIAIGLALQGTLANVAAGVLIVTLKLYRVGDVIEVLGHTGTVRIVSLFTTELETFAGRQVLLPNGEVLKQPIVNITRYERRRVDVNLILPWTCDAQEAGAIALAAIRAAPGVLASPEPAFVISAFDPRGPLLSVRVWADREPAGRLALEGPLLVHQALRAAGIALNPELSLSGQPAPPL